MKNLLNNTALLLGAGFTKNFGGPLASELWAKIFNNDTVQGSEFLVNTFRNEQHGFDFEEIYGSIRSEFPDEFLKLYKALDDAFDDIDAIIRNFAETESTPSLQKLFEWFTRFHGLDGKKGLVFSLNQDLFFERKMSLTLPGLQRGQHFIQGGRYGDSRILMPKLEKITYQRVVDDLDHLSLVKMHGSCNWFSSDGSQYAVIGTNKQRDIKDRALLDCYSQLFEEWLSEKNRCLWIIGYGFRDRHINNALIKAIEANGLSLFIVNPADPRHFYDEINWQGEARSIWAGLRGYFPYSLREIFPVSGGGQKLAKELISAIDRYEQ